MDLEEEFGSKPRPLPLNFETLNKIHVDEYNNGETEEEKNRVI